MSRARTGFFLKPPGWRRTPVLLTALGAALVVAVLASLGLGSVTMGPGRVAAAVFHPASAQATDVVIVRDLRLPRTLLAALVGGALAAAGAAFQGLFRNPLADPHVIGASSGAALGATVAISCGLGATALGFGPVPLAAFAGALATVAVVYVVAESGAGGASVAGLLLAGTAMGSMLSALVSFLLIWQEQPWFHVFGWLLGGFSGRSWHHLWVALPWLSAGAGALWLMSRPLDALTGGDDVARGLGLSIRTTRLLLVSAAGLVVAAAVAVSGIIGFVGLVAPHIARWLVGAGHARMIPVSVLLGAVLLVAADTAARTLLAATEIPVGILTAALGGPYFLWLLKTRGRRMAA
jgi:iron complex transport system permease protein